MKSVSYGKDLLKDWVSVDFLCTKESEISKQTNKQLRHLVYNDCNSLSLKITCNDSREKKKKKKKVHRI